MEVNSSAKPLFSINRLISVIIVSMLLYGVWILWSGYVEVLQGIQRVGWSGFAILLLLSLINYAVRFVRWHWMLARITSITPPFTRHAQYYLAGFALTATPGKAGEVIRSLYLRPYGVKMADSVAGLFVERLLDLMAMMLIAALALVRFEQYRWLGVVVLTLVVLTVLLIRSQTMLTFLRTWQASLTSIRMRQLLGHLLNVLDASSRFMTGPIWAGGLLLGVLAWGAEAWGFVLLVNWLGGGDWAFLAAGIYALGMIVGAVSFLPGGLGGAEAVMASLLLLLGVTTADAATATIICRIATLWFAVAIGIVTLGWLQLQGATIVMGTNTKKKSDSHATN